MDLSEVTFNGYSTGRIPALHFYDRCLLACLQLCAKSTLIQLASSATFYAGRSPCLQTDLLDFRKKSSVRSVEEIREMSGCCCGDEEEPQPERLSSYERTEQNIEDDEVSVCELNESNLVANSWQDDDDGALSLEGIFILMLYCSTIDAYSHEPHRLTPSTSHCLTASLPHYLIVSLSHCLTASLSHCFTASLSHCLPASLPHCLNVSLPQCLTASLPHCLNVSLSHYLIASLPHCLTTSLPHCLTSMPQIYWMSPEVWHTRTVDSYCCSTGVVHVW